MRGSQWGLASTLLFCSIIAAFGGFAANAEAADECLSGPKGSTPQGKHWYYRIERPSKRHCWYLADEGRRTSQTASADAPSENVPSERPASKRNSEAMPPAVADARAELTKDVAVPFTAMPPFGQQSTGASASLENPTAQGNENVAPPNNWRVAERWPDQTSNSFAQTETTTPPTLATPPAPAPAQTQIAQQPIAQQAIAPAAATPDDSSDMLRIVLGILTAAIALAAIIGRLILTHMRPRARPARRRPIWQPVDNNNALRDSAPARVHDPALRARAERDVEDLLRALRYPEDRRPTSPIVSADRGQRPTGRSGARA